MTLKEALNNEEIAKKFETAGSMEEVLGILKDNGVEATEEELFAAIGEMGEQGDGELSDESLEKVAGGVNFFGLGAKVLLMMLKLGKIKAFNLPRAVLRMLGK